LVNRRFYEERYCAFVDILGFSNYVHHAFTAAPPKLRAERIENIASLNGQIGKELIKISNEFPKISFSHFSDSIFLSVPTRVQDAIGQLFYRIQRISTALLIRGFLTRGGIVRGLVHYRDGDVFGPGLIEAYRLESLVARHPRIVVGRSVREALQESDDGWRKLIEASDGPFYLNCIQLFEDLAEQAKRKGFPNLFDDQKYKMRFDFLIQICKFLARELEAARDRPEIYAKIRWLANEFDRLVLSKGDSKFPGWPQQILVERA
jgi:hypothetical protein